MVRSQSLIAAGVLVLGAIPQTGSLRWPANTVLKSQICVERPGDTGRLNVRAADVVIEGGPTLTLLGEQAACAYVQPGRYRVWVQSKDPFDRTSANPQAWKSTPLLVTAPANDRAQLEVCGAGPSTAYTNWKIARTGRCQ